MYCDEIEPETARLSIDSGVDIHLHLFCAIALTISSNTNLLMSNNYAHAQVARLQAESGLGYYAYYLRNTAVPGDVRAQELLDALAETLSDELDDSPNLNGATISYDGAAIIIPQITTIGGGTFSAAISTVSDDILRIAVTGNVIFGDGQLTRSLQRCVAVDFTASPSGPAFNYGLFSKGPIVIGQNLKFVGANNPGEASMYSTAEGNAITVESGLISGNVCTAYEDVNVDVGATVGGEIRLGIGQIAPPVIDASMFEDFATNPVDEETDTSGGTFTNIRVLAGTHPEFGTVTILGVMYVEAPNRVNFTNNVEITGVIVTEDPGEDASPLEHNIYFKNNLTIHGVELLPDTPPFAQLRTMPGTAILAPGFAVEFKNNFQSVSGIIAADSIILKNNLDAILYGSIIVFGDQGLELKNNATIIIDRSAYPGIPAGIIPTETKLTPNPDSYMEN